MAGVFVFDESNAPVTYMLKAGLGRVSLALWIKETITKERVYVVKCKDFEIYLSYFSFCYLKVREERFLICPKVKCNTWNQILIEDGSVKFNEFSRKQHSRWLLHLHFYCTDFYKQ